MDTRFKKGDARLMGNKYALGHKPNITSFRKGEHPSSNTEFKKGIIPHNKGIKTVFPKCKVCENPVGDNRTKICRKCFVKENHCQWRGGKSFEEYGVAFNFSLKEKIRLRDKYRCQECFRHQEELYDKGGKKYKLCIHHIDYNKKNNEEENLISLCRSCHLQTNYNRKDWENYYKLKTQQV